MTRQLIVARLPQRLDAPCRARWTHECMLLARRCVQFAVCCMLFALCCIGAPCALDALCNPLPTLPRHAHARTHARTSNRTYARARTHTCACVHARTHAHAHTQAHTRARAHAHSLETYLFDLGPSFVPLIMPRSQRLALSRLRPDY